MLRKELIELHVRAESAEAVIRLLGGKMQELGLVSGEYVNAVLDREKQFPTGLPTAGIHIAIPHTSGTYVNTACVGVATLEEPVLFESMEGTGEQLEVGIVILLAIADSQQQLSFLKTLMKVFQDADILLAMKNAQTKDALMDVLKPLLGQADGVEV